ncbi:MAG: glucosamine-6-phosphate deaminase [Elusimicrobia bacterium]|nr:glucosamine-6-phosphate deaminase [Elusimicrobiota bacterium]
MRLIVPQISVGKYAAALFKERFNKKKNLVLALPTGETAVEMYAGFVKMHKNGDVSFKNIKSFNLDEYVGVEACHPQSYCSFMQNNLYNHVDIKKENIFMPDGTAEDIEKECLDYERKIKNAGGIDLLFGGVGQNGHLGFNEPYSALRSRTHKVFLTKNTIAANSRFFTPPQTPPDTAITMGVGTILDANEIVILASGFKKAEALRAAVEGPVCAKWVISALQIHPKAVIVADAAACSNLEPATFEYFKNLKDEYSEIEKLCL